MLLICTRLKTCRLVELKKKIFDKRSWKKEKMLIPACSFSTRFSALSLKNPKVCTMLNFFVYKWDQSTIMSYRKGLTLSQTSPGFYVSAM